MVYCAVRGCSSTNNKKCTSYTKGYRFFTFPKNKTVCTKWILCCRHKKINVNTARICSKHFKENDFQYKEKLLKLPKNKWKLKRDAIPSKHIIPNPVEDQLETNRNQTVKKGELVKPIYRQEILNGGETHDSQDDDDYNNVNGPMKRQNIAIQTERNHVIKVEDLSVDFPSVITNGFAEFEANIPVKVEEDNNLQKMRCRTCLSTSEDNNYYCPVIETCTNTITIKDAILWLVPNLKPELQLDDVVCKDCVQSLKNTIAFVTKCLTADAKLLQELENNKCTKENNSVVIEKEEVIDDDFMSLHEYDNFDVSDFVSVELKVTKEQEFWNQCREYIQFKKEPQEITKTLDETNLENHDSIISIGPLNDYVTPNLLENLQEQVDFVNHFNSLGEKKSQRILLICSKLYKNCPVCPKKFTSDFMLNNHFEEKHGTNYKTSLIKPFQKHSAPNSLSCATCGKYFQTHIRRQRHILNCAVFNCPHCGDIFSEPYLNAHIKKNHPASFPLKCFRCHEEFQQYHLFENHKCSTEIICENGDTIQKVPKKQQMKNLTECFHCKQLLPFEQYDDHILLVHRKYQCSKCNQRFFDDDRLKRHELMHQRKIKEHPCGMCDEIFSNRRSLIAHQRTHRTSLCTQCGKFISDAVYSRHVYNHKEVQEEEIKLECPVCNKVFHNRKYYRAHIYRSHESPPVACDICGVVVKAVSLRHHKNFVHTKAKKYECTICKKKFSRRDYLAKHVGIHGIENHYTRQAIAKRKGDLRSRRVFRKLDKPITCKICFKKFKLVCNLRVHMERHMKLIRFKCRYCDMTYSERTNRMRHEKLHKNSDYKFRCNTCWRKFTSQEELDVHEFSQHKKKFDCEYCDKAFSREYEFLTHMVEVHCEQEALMREKENLVLESLAFSDELAATDT